MGKYRSSEEVVQHGLRLLMERQAKLARNHAEVQVIPKEEAQLEFVSLLFRAHIASADMESYGDTDEV